MRTLVTAGSTIAPIDQVRALSNIFQGHTGTAIAKYFAEQGEEVILLTSSPKLAPKLPGLQVVRFRTFDELESLMREYIDKQKGGPLDTIIHSAAVGDYRVEGVFSKQEGQLVELDSSGKVGSDHSELFLRLVPTPKLVDLIRSPWNFTGQLVKFKLQVGMSDGQLLEIANRSMHHSGADHIVANCLEWSGQRAFLLSAKGNRCLSVVRQDLAWSLYKHLRNEE